MKTSICSIALFALLSLFACAGAPAQDAPLAPNASFAPQDKPKTVDSDEAYVAYEKAVAPYIAKARESYPDAKQRFLSGQLATLPFFVTVRLSENGRYEDSFVRVLLIDEASGDISGKIANEIQMLHNYHNGQRIVVHEADVRDWTIIRADGSQEGNIVGKFLERYQQ